MAGPYVTSSAAARALGIGRSTLNRWVNAGFIQPAFTTPAGYRRWDLEDLRRQLHAKPRTSGEPMTDRAPADKPQPPAVIAAVVTSNRGLLAGRRNDGKPPWTLIAGENEPGESPADTIVREVKEETGLRITPGEMIGERAHPKTGRWMVYVAARPTTSSTAIMVGDPDELAEVRWIPTLKEADELLPGMFEPVRQHLARILRASRRNDAAAGLKAARGAAHR